ncbi:PEP-CTERM sorting domain-containing protein [Gloeothece verrucosa]|uniref:Uncharacterized protein n=1 Tax=Gloeothece verrucosa (strain PCC 7822) TaxID=497965 RepID=E0ULQ1_GLOV7|nr:PEP-CTERM sorting domain-containing protein [Gloeothece verrucosa]ADN17881.1 hypothetical protein Cyan7822_6034 [Gloeothece verrucosa PCC 7822]
MSSIKNLAITVGAILVTLETGNIAKAAIFLGNSPQKLGNGMINSYVVVDDLTGEPASIGLTFDVGILSGLSDGETDSEDHSHEHEHIDTVMLSLPSQASSTAFEFVAVNWNPDGHPPTGVYNTPHFDFHFYTIPQSIQQQINPANPQFPSAAYKVPPPGFVPADYYLIPNTAVPGEGSHWANFNAPEWQGVPHGFEQTFLYGYWQGIMAFQEPMVTYEFLINQQNRSTFSEAINLPAFFPKTAFYPTSYSISFDSSTSIYNVSLDHLTWRVATPVPEPFTLLGAGIAVGFGFLFKQKFPS